MSQPAQVASTFVSLFLVHFKVKTVRIPPSPNSAFEWAQVEWVSETF